MPVNAIQRTVALDREDSFGEGIDDWTSLSANGSMLYVIGLNTEGLQQAMLEDENIRRRASDERPMFLGLKSESSFSFEMYQHGDPNPSADAGVQGARLGRDDILLNGLGGEYRSYATEMVGGTTTAPTVTEGDLASQEAFSWGFFYDASAGTGAFRFIAAIVEGSGSPDTLTLAPGHPLPFTPAAEDPVYAVVSHYPDWDVLEDHANGSHISNTMMLYGRHAEDTFEPRGVAFSVSLGPIESGTATKWAVSARCATFTNVEDVAQPALTGAPSGQHGPVVGSGQTTICLIGNTGFNLATQQFQGQITVNLGIERDPDMGPNGLEGVHGFGISEASYASTSVELTVPFDASWFTDFRANTRKHMLIQVGDQPALSWFIYFPALSWAAEPKRISNNGRVSLTLSFKALEPFPDYSVTDMRARAKFHIGRVATAEEA